MGLTAAKAHYLALKDQAITTLPLPCRKGDATIASIGLLSMNANNSNAKIAELIL
jgi:hypothetical protein